MLQVFYKNTDTVAQTVWSAVVSLIADHVIEYTKSRVSRALFKKRNLLSLLKVPNIQILEVEEKKTKQCVIILRSFSILPSHSAVGTSETGYHYYLRPLQRYHICNILQGVYEVLLCRRIYKQIRLVQCMNPFPAVSEVLRMLNNKFSL